MPVPGGNRRSNASSSRRTSGLRGAWCCSFAASPQSPDCRPSSQHLHKQPLAATVVAPKVPSGANSLHSSPSPSSKLGLGIIDPRRILSPGRVSPINSDVPLAPLPENTGPAVSINKQEITDLPVSGGDPPSSAAEVDSGECDQEKGLDLRLKVTGRDGRCLSMEMDSKVLCANSSYFAGMVLRSRQKVSDALNDCWEIEVAGVDDLDVFREMIEMMYERDEMNWLMKAGVSRAIDVLELSAAVMFDRGTMSCLKYLEAVPWSEHEEEKLKSAFSRREFDESICEEVLARLLRPEAEGGASEELAIELIRSVAYGTNSNARKELQALVNGLLSKSSVYSKELAVFNIESLYSICDTCVRSLLELFKEASSSTTSLPAKQDRRRPLVERVSKQVENLNWLLDILIDKQMAVDFVCMWAAQDELTRLHERSSSMIRYELSRVSASVFVAMGRGKVHCGGDVRYAVIRRWFRPLVADFGWIQRCPKGLDVRMLEDGLGQAILTLPMKQQQTLFVEWFQFFGTHGTECPNLSKAFQVWWRRSFLRGMDVHSLVR